MIYELLRCPATYAILQPFAIRFFSYENRFLLMFVRVTKTGSVSCKQEWSLFCDTLDHITFCRGRYVRLRPSAAPWSGR